MFDFILNINHYSTDGLDSDTVGFLGLTMSQTGLPDGFDEVAFTITIGPFDSADIGKTICLDSSLFGAKGYWGWSYPGGADSYYPSWDGPHCFTISNSIMYSGQILYYEPTPSGSFLVPMCNTRIEMYDYDGLSDDSLGITMSDDSGYFHFDPVDNDDGWFDDSLDIYFKIKAVNESAYYTEEYAGDTLMVQSEVQHNLASGFHDTTIIADTNSRGIFYVISAMQTAHDFWDSTTGFNLNPIQIVYEDHNDSLRSYYWSGYEYIHIESYDSALIMFPDTFDDDVIYHEYGHYIEDMHDFFDNGGGGHGWFDILNPGLAASEGFASFFSGLV